MQVVEHFLKVGEMVVRYERAGSGQPLLLLHGLVGSSRNWRRNIEAFAGHSTVFALDLPNMGGSERVQGLDASLEATADRLAATMDVLGIEAADIAAHSHGGAVALMFAARHPNRTRRLVLFAPANPFCDLGRRLVHFYSTRVGLGFAKLIPRLPMQWKAIALRRMYGDERRVPADALAGYTEGLQVPGTIDHVMQIVARWREDMVTLRAQLGALVEVPTLLVWGDRDRAVGLQSATELRRSLPRAELVTLSGVGHIAFEEVPEAVNSTVARWLEATPCVAGTFRPVMHA
jgi:4,5:9,10-diseco-3-hydroxy-5,9,17-trioxoandrosta-1(10),2-diene-4-oate hydrolase